MYITPLLPGGGGGGEGMGGMGGGAGGDMGRGMGGGNMGGGRSTMGAVGGMRETSPAMQAAGAAAAALPRFADARAIPLAMRMPPVAPIHNLNLGGNRLMSGGVGGGPNAGGQTPMEIDDAKNAVSIYAGLPGVEDGMRTLVEHDLSSTSTYMKEHFPMAELGMLDLLPGPDSWDLVSNQLQGSMTIPECLRRVGYGYAYERRCTVMLRPG
uniref:Uncharacterized protein n=1 Tax=Odontella aurita TaxID=265563 RepID=A0A7S4MLA4_9STRA